MPGVYYIAASCGPSRVADEYYVVDDDTSIISQTAKRYGRRLHWSLRGSCSMTGMINRAAAALLNMRLQNTDTGIIFLTRLAPRCMTLRYITWNTIRSTLEHTQRRSAPLYGYTTRYQALINGVFWIETDQCKEVLAVCYPMWNGDFSDGVMELGVTVETDEQVGMDTSLGYLFFEKTAGSLALFEQWQIYDSLRNSGYIDYPALMNYIWKYAPEYAAAHNLSNQFGLYDTFGLLLNALGEEQELQNFPENNISISAGSRAAISENMGIAFLDPTGDFIGVMVGGQSPCVIHSTKKVIRRVKDFCAAGCMSTCKAMKP